jgi:HJR/Mrr/RecB family endonuclease
MVVPSTLLGVLKAKPAFIFQISHREFEELIRDILRSMGFDVHLTAQTRVGGCDLIAVSRDVLGIQTKYVIEAKHYTPTNKVGVQLVRQLNTVRIREGAHHGVLVTSSYSRATRSPKTGHSMGYNLRTTMPSSSGSRAHRCQAKCRHSTASCAYF